MPDNNKPKITIHDSFYTSNPEFIGSETNKTFGQSKYDTNVPVSMVESGDYNYLRGERQSVGDKAANGVLRALTKTGIRAINGVVSPFYGLASSLYNQDASRIWDNKLTELTMDLEKGLDESLPLYNTKAYENAHGLSKLLYANTLYGDIMDGISYSGAAALSGVGIGRIMSLAGKLATVGKGGEFLNGLKNIQKVDDVINHINKYENTYKNLVDGSKQAFQLYTSASTEATIEAKQAADEWEKDIINKISFNTDGSQREPSQGELDYIKMLRKQVGNSTFAFNLPVIMTDNLISFGRAMLGNKATNSTLKELADKAIFNNTTNTYKAAKKTAIDNLLDKTYGVRQMLTPMIAEGNQEMLQYAVQKGTQDYYTKRYYNPNADDVISSISKGLYEAYGTQEGWDQGLIGALSSGIFSNSLKLKTEGLQGFKNPHNDEAINHVIDYLNNLPANSAYNELLKSYIRHSNLSEEQDNAISNNDEHAYGNASSDMFLNYVTSRIKTGKVEDLKNDLESFKKLSADELKQQGIELSTDELLGHKQSVIDYVQSRLDKISKIEKLNDTIEKSFPDAPDNIKDRLIHAAWSIEDSSKRIKELHNSVNNLLNHSNNTQDLISINLLNGYQDLSKEQRDSAKKAIEENKSMSPHIQDEVLSKIADIDKLINRRDEFINAYKALKEPSIQEAINKADEQFDNEASNIISKPVPEESDNVTPEEAKHEVTKNEPIEVKNQPVDLGLNSGDIDLSDMPFLDQNGDYVVPDKTTEKSNVSEVSDIKDEIPENKPKENNPNEIYPGLNRDFRNGKEGTTNDNNYASGDEVRTEFNRILNNTIGASKNPNDYITIKPVVRTSYSNKEYKTVASYLRTLDNKIILLGDLQVEHKDIIDLVHAANRDFTPSELSINWSLTKPNLDIADKETEQPKLSELKGFDEKTWAIVDLSGSIPAYINNFDTSLLPYGEHNFEDIKNELSKNNIDTRYVLIIPQAGKYYSVALRNTELEGADRENYINIINDTINQIKAGNDIELTDINNKLKDAFIAISLDNVKGLKLSDEPSLKVNLEVNSKAGINVQILDHSKPLSINGKSKISFDVPTDLTYTSLVNMVNTELYKNGVTIGLTENAFKYNDQSPEHLNAAVTKDVFRKYDYQLVFDKVDSTKKQSIPDLGKDVMLPAGVNMDDVLNEPVKKVKTKKRLGNEFDDVFSIGDKQGLGISESEIEDLKRILPSFITIDDISTIIDNLKVNGVTYGAFRDKVIYLNKTKGKPGTGYHEAFHAVFRTILSTQDINKYLKAAENEFKGDFKVATKELVSRVPQYKNKSYKELKELVLEEYMADRFSEFAINKSTKTTGSILKQLFNKIINIFKAIFNSDNLDTLYNNIYNGSFANSEFRGNRLYSTGTVFKLLPRGETEVGFKYFNPNRSRVIINTYAALVHKEVINGNTNSKEDILDSLIKQRYDSLDTDGRDYVDEVIKTDRDKALKISQDIEDELYLLDPESADGDALKLLKSEVLNRLKTFNYEDKVLDDELLPEDTDETIDDNETAEIKEQLGSKDAWLVGGHDSLSKTIKSYIAFTTYQKLDPLTNKMVEVGIDEVVLYNGLIRILSDTNEVDMFDKLAFVADSNDNIKAFLDRITSELGIKFVNGKYTQPTDINAYNTFRLFVSNFKKSRATQVMTTVSPDGTYKVFNANQNEPKKIALNQWENNLTIIKQTNSNMSLAKHVTDAANRLNKGINSLISDDELNDNAKFIKDNLLKVGIDLSVPYIKYSILRNKVDVMDAKNDKLDKDKQLFISDLLTTNQIRFLSINSVKPLTYDVLLGNPKFNLASLIADNKEIYKKTEDNTDIASRLEEVADGNSYFDESIGMSSFKNAEGNTVYEIINKSYVLDQAEKLNNPQYLKSLEDGIKHEYDTEARKKNADFVKDNYLLKNHKESLLTSEIQIINGLRNESEDKGITYGSFDARSYYGTALAYFANKLKDNNVRYIFRQNEASSTGYVVTLPRIDVLSNGRLSSKVLDIFRNKLKQEFDRISRESQLGFGTGKIKDYNDKPNGKAYYFAEFSYLAFINPELYNNLTKAAQEGNSDYLKDKTVINSLNSAIESYLLNEGFSRFKDELTNSGFITSKHNFIPKQLLEQYKDIDTALKEFYINDYIMSSSYNELLDGDYALSRSTKGFVTKTVNGIDVIVPKVAYGIDVVKRHKGGMASGADFGKGYHKVSYIKDITGYIVTKAIDGNFIRVNEVDGRFIGDNGKEYSKDELSDITTNDAQSYSSQWHHMFGNIRLGRFDKRVANAYKSLIQFTYRNEEGNIIKNINITEKDQEYLENALASANSKKTITFDGLSGIYHKLSEAGLWRSSISYVSEFNVDEFQRLTDRAFELLLDDKSDIKEFKDLVSRIADLYEPIPGMEYLHNLANKMDKAGIDQVITESASKGATISPVDSFNGDLSESSQLVPNSAKRLQTETPTGKDVITAGSQLINLIDTELDDEHTCILPNGESITLGKARDIYRNLMNQTRDNSFKQALTFIKDIGNQVDITKLREKIVSALEANNTDENLLELFESGYNLNIPTILDKSEQVVLSHFSKGVLNQKVNGTKVSLMSDAGIDVVRDSNDNVIGIHQVLRNPEKYKGEGYTKSKLKYNVKDANGRRFSECMLSERILTKHGIKLGTNLSYDDIKNYPELFEAIGYRIPTQGHQSMMNLKVVGLLPNYYEGVGIFPMEIVYLSGADFDIDSEFIQLPQFWIDAKGKPVKYGSETTIKDKWDGYKYYNISYNKDFKKAFKKLLKEDLTKDEAYIRASIELGLPVNQDAYTDNVNNALLNNKSLDLMTSILSSKYVQNNSANNGTTVDPMKKVANKIENLKSNTNKKYKVPEDYVSHSDINGKVISNSKNSAGKSGIGIVANKVQQLTFLLKDNNGKGIDFKDDVKSWLLGDKHGKGYNTVIDNNRVMDTMGVMLNIMTDNAKDPIAGRMNLSLELLNGYTELLAQGMDPYAAGVLINQPIIQLYSKYKKVLNYQLKTDVEGNLTNSKIIKAAITSYIIDKYDSKTLKDLDMKKIDDLYGVINLADLEDVIKGDNKKNLNYNSKLTDGKLDLDKLDSHDLLQIKALLQFNNAENQANDISKLNNYLKLNQGLPASFAELSYSLKDAEDKLSKAHIDIEHLLNRDTLTKGNKERAEDVLKRVGKIFIEQTDSFKNELDKLTKSLSQSYLAERDTAKNLSREFLAYVSTKALKSYFNSLTLSKNQNVAEQANNKLKSFTLELLYKQLGKTLADRLIELQNSTDPEIKNNALIKYLKPVLDNPDGIHTIDGRSFSKESSATISMLADAGRALLTYNDVTKKFYTDLFSYLVVKDNLRFKYGSVSKYLIAGMYSTYSKTLDLLNEGFNEGNNNLFGNSFDEDGYNFRKLFVTYKPNSKNISLYASIPVNTNGLIKTDNSIKLNTYDNGLLTDVSSKFELVNDKSKKYIFPQFHTFKIGNQTNVYELVNVDNESHNKNDSYGVGYSAEYNKLEYHGNKLISPYSFGTYDNAISIDKQVLSKPNKSNSTVDTKSKYDLEDSSELTNFVNISTPIESTFDEMNDMIREELKDAYEEYKSKSKVKSKYDLGTIDDVMKNNPDINDIIKPC